MTVKLPPFLWPAFLLAAAPLQAQEAPVTFPALQGPYLGQKLPGSVPEPFALEIMDALFGSFHSNVVFSPDGKAAYWQTGLADGSRLQAVFESRWEERGWTRSRRTESRDWPAAPANRRTTIRDPWPRDRMDTSLVKRLERRGPEVVRDRWGEDPGRGDGVHGMIPLKPSLPGHRRVPEENLLSRAGAPPPWMGSSETCGTAVTD